MLFFGGSTTIGINIKNLGGQKLFSELVVIMFHCNSSTL